MIIREILNLEEIDGLREELSQWTEYIPLELTQLVQADYWERCSKEAKREYHQKRQGYDGTDEYLINDVLGWVKKYPQFEKYIINE